MTRSVRYENTLIGLMFLTFGTIFLDRMAQFYLAPYLIPDLHVNNIQIGMMASALALAWAGSSLVFGAICDRYGRLTGRQEWRAPEPDQPHMQKIEAKPFLERRPPARIEACSTPWHDRERPVAATERTQFWRAARTFRLAATVAVALILVLGSGVASAAS